MNERQTHHNESASTVGLIRQLANEISTLFSKEVALAKSEVAESIHDAKAGLASTVTGGSVLYAGFLFLLGAAVLGLTEIFAIALWLSTLIVGAVVALIGLIMMQSGKKKMQASSFKPERTIQSLHKDQRTMRGAAA